MVNRLEPVLTLVTVPFSVVAWPVPVVGVGVGGRGAGVLVGVVVGALPGVAAVEGVVPGVEAPGVEAPAVGVPGPVEEVLTSNCDCLVEGGWTFPKKRRRLSASP